MNDIIVRLYMDVRKGQTEKFIAYSDMIGNDKLPGVARYGIDIDVPDGNNIDRVLKPKTVIISD